MADSASEFESDTSSIDGGPVLKSSLPGHIEHLNKRIDSLQQENRVLRVELETYKMKCRTLQEDNRELRRASVTIVGTTRAISLKDEPPEPPQYWCVCASRYYISS